MNNIDIDHLRLTITVAWHAREHGNHPFGAMLVDEHNRVLLQAENTVLTAHDVTGHAETNLVCHVRRGDPLESNRESGICPQRS